MIREDDIGPKRVSLLHVWAAMQDTAFRRSCFLVTPHHGGRDIFDKTNQGLLAFGAPERRGVLAGAVARAQAHTVLTRDWAIGWVGHVAWLHHGAEPRWVLSC
jgi:hypothetical protein